MSLRRSLWAQLLGLGGSSSSDEDNGEPQQSAAPAEHAGARELRPVSATHAAAASRSVASTTAPADLVHYAVRKGDTWAGVALRHGMTLSQLLRANRASGSGTPTVGQRLWVRSLPLGDRSSMSPTATTSSISTSMRSAPTSTARSAAAGELGLAALDAAATPAAEAPPAEATAATSAASAQLREDAFYCAAEFNVRGTLVITPDIAAFEPSAADKHVRKRGRMQFQFCIDMRDIKHCGAVTHSHDVPMAAQSRVDSASTPAAEVTHCYLQIMTNHSLSGRSGDDQVFFIVRASRLETIVDTLCQWIAATQAMKHSASASASLTSGTYTNADLTSPVPLFAREAGVSDPFAAPPDAPASLPIAVERSRSAAGLASSSAHDRRASSTSLTHSESDSVLLAGDASSVTRSQSASDSVADILAALQADAQRVRQAEERTAEARRIVVNPSISRVRVPRFLGGDAVLLTPRLAMEIEALLPLSSRGHDWRLLYRLTKHGVSLSTLLMRTRDEGPTVLLLQSADDELVGGFASEPWRVEAQYYGTGESFLFRYVDGKFESYHWTGKNAYFLLAKEDCIAMGGGGHFGLYLDGDLLHGTSGPSETFGNPPLTQSSHFTCVELEVWGFASLYSE